MGNKMSASEKNTEKPAKNEETVKVAKTKKKEGMYSVVVIRDLIKTCKDNKPVSA